VSLFKPIYKSPPIDFYNRALVSDYPPANLAVYITTDGVIYRDNVVDMATGKVTPKGFPTKSPQQQEAKNLYDANNIPLPSIAHTSWKPILILAPLRLGIDALHPNYYATLKALFQLPWFVGIAGGKPNSSLYFIGCQGDDFIYLDPHFSRPALETKPLMYYTMSDFGTYHCTVPRKIHVSHLDPSMMLSFFCHTRHEFDALCVQLENVSLSCKKGINIWGKLKSMLDIRQVYPSPHHPAKSTTIR
jgi:cysteine protease ATG4